MAMVWLSPEILEWTPSLQGWKNQPELAWKRAHTLWDHADRTIQSADGELSLVDGVTALKRGLNKRTRHLLAAFSLQAIPLSQKPRGTLELLEYVGVIKPVLFHRLLSIRNALEHEDSPPPPRSQCLELSEFVWYFLRATDMAARWTPTAVGLTIPDDEGDYFTYEGWGRGIKVTTGPEVKWQIEIDATMPSEAVSLTERAGWLAFAAESIQTRVECGLDEADETLPVDDFFIKGKFSGTPTQRDSIYRIYFRAV